VNRFHWDNQQCCCCRYLLFWIVRLVTSVTKPVYLPNIIFLAVLNFFLFKILNRGKIEEILYYTRFISRFVALFALKNVSLKLVLGDSKWWRISMATMYENACGNCVRRIELTFLWQLPEVFSSSPDIRVFVARKLHEGVSPRVILSDKHECRTARKNFWRYISVPRYFERESPKKTFP
jgi:hypothetical protein